MPTAMKITPIVRRAHFSIPPRFLIVARQTCPPGPRNRAPADEPGV